MSWPRLEGRRGADYLQSCRSYGPADPQPELAQRGRGDRHRGGRTARAGGVEGVDALRQPARGGQPGKRNRLRKLTVRWLSTHGIRFDQVRIDVVGLVYEGADGAPSSTSGEWTGRAARSPVLGRVGGSGRPCGRGGHRQRTGRDDPGRPADTALGLPAVQCRPFPRQGSWQLSRFAAG
jgi:hypothetical protein